MFQWNGCISNNSNFEHVDSSTHDHFLFGDTYLNNHIIIQSSNTYGNDKNKNKIMKRIIIKRGY